METATLEHIHNDLEFIKQKISILEVDIKVIKEEVELEVRPEYLRKLAKIEKGKGKIFTRKEDFLHFLEHEL